MKSKKLALSILALVTMLIIMRLPVSEADAAASASDFRIEGDTLVRYRGTEKNVSVPDTVKTIGQSAFEENKNIELVVLPNSVSKIEPYAFWGCDNLDTVVLGKGLEEVGDYAFAGCKGLVQMSVPSNVTSIGIQAFGGCTNLKDISISSKTGIIHETAFDGCAAVTIHCDPGSAADKFAKEFYERQKKMPGYEEIPDTADSAVSDSETWTPVTDPVSTETPEEPPQGEILGTTQIVGNMAVVFADNRQFQVYGGIDGSGSQASESGTSGDGEQALDGIDSGSESAGGAFPSLADIFNG
ncbi:MAG: leucine-rich repeat domain-containing protein, partial [Lachnospiraceae bacterium]|nr:leucine-rich repeat domain-containing protein [Lachnospiraceae bacterium]